MHAIVTGASSGIGEAIAKALAGEGYDLTLIARRESELRRVAHEIGQAVATHIETQDLAETGHLHAIVERAESKLGPIDILVNNAGYEIVGRSTGVSDADVERITRVNYLAPCALTRAVAQGMCARGHRRERGFRGCLRAAAAAYLLQCFQSSAGCLLRLHPGRVSQERRTRGDGLSGRGQDCHD